MSKQVAALFNNTESARLAVDQLVAKGVAKDKISVLMSDSTRGKEFAVEVNTKAPEGAAAGALTGGTLGAIAAGLTAVGSVALTGGASLVAVGPAVAALAGAGAGAAGGGLIGGLVGLGFEETEAKFVDQDIENGSILVGAEVPSDRISEIKSALENTGAKKVTKI